MEQAARLCGLVLEPGELEQYRQQLGQLLSHMDRLSRLAPGGELAEQEPHTCPLRDDQPEGSPLAAAIMAQAPAVAAGGFFSVPRPRA